MTDKNTELPQDPKTVDANATEARAAEARAAELKAAEARAAEAKAAEAKAAEAKAAEAKAAEAKAAEAKAAEAKAAEAKAAEAKAVRSSSPPRPEPARPAQSPAGGKPSGGKRSGGLAGPVLVIAIVLAIVVAGALWYQQKRFNDVAAQLQQQASASADAARQADQQVRQAAQKIQQQAGQLTALESTLSETRHQLDSLQQAFQMVTDSGSELVLLNDIDHLVTIAQQQLQLGGNVANAIISLETAQAQLARANRPGLASLQQTVNGDLDRLRAATTVDIALLSSQLDEFAKLVSAAPLLMPDDAAPALTTPPAQGQPAAEAPGQGKAAAPAADQPWWKRGLDTVADWSESAWTSVRQDLGAFIAVRRVDDEAALLMSPDQAARFRESLRLRVMTAQLALMMHQPGIWETETHALLQAVERRFDPQSAQSRQALKLARQFADTPIDVTLPTVDNSLRAIETLRGERERDDAKQAVPGASEAGKKGDAAQPAAASKGAQAAPQQGAQPAQPQSAQPAPQESATPAQPQGGQPAPKTPGNPSSASIAPAMVALYFSSNQS